MAALTSLPQIAVAQLGARMHYAVPVILHRAGMLERLYTDAYAGPGSWLGQVLHRLPRQWRPQAMERLRTRIAPLPGEKVVSFNSLGFLYLLANSQQYYKNTLKIYLLINKVFNRWVRTKITASAQAVYGFDKSSVELFHWGKRRGLKCILDQAANPWEITSKIYCEANRKCPEWADGQDQECLYPLLQGEKKEWELADLILCPSEFVYSSFLKLGIPQKKLALVPYGVNLNYWQGEIRKYHKNMALEIIFVGSGTLFKGLPFLLEAISTMADKNIRLTIVGKLPDNIQNYLITRKNITHTGQVPRSEVKKYYDKAHVFIFPSVSEGSATVTYEALATGLPVITTPNSGSLVRDHMEGFIVPPLASKGIVRALEQFLEHPELVEVMSRNALQRAKEFSWERYGERLTACLQALWN